MSSPAPKTEGIENKTKNGGRGNPLLLRENKEDQVTISMTSPRKIVRGIKMHRSCTLKKHLKIIYQAPESWCLEGNEGRGRWETPQSTVEHRRFHKRPLINSQRKRRGQGKTNFYHI